MATWSSRYRYGETEVKKYAPKTGGVYRLLFRRGEKYYVLYVGQSNDLRRRLLQHLSADEPDVCIKRHLRDYSCYFRFLQLSSKSDRDRVEQEQIDKYDPVCND